MSLDRFLEETKLLVDKALDRWLPPKGVKLHDAMRYAVFAGGKRLRPAIARAACHAVGGTDDEILPVACALEMLHTYSLIHDDLPAIDDDDLRRGKPTCHRRFDEATAILAGDALQTHAFLILAERTPRRDAVPTLVLDLARAAGTDGMVGGEIADIEAEGQAPDLSVVESIHARKTGALLSASAVMGGGAGGASPAQRKALAEFGTALGIAFQIVDDILDETQDAATLGKSPGKDKKDRKMTYPAAVGLDRSRQRAAELKEEAVKALARAVKAPMLVQIADLVVKRSR
ncbi:MAG TPA: farnesyl diphosphate synthase [Planctomycetota bacterium]|nr:farnesyl diphosphate synthase [Planctomycetota bacterium]